LIGNQITLTELRFSLAVQGEAPTIGNSVSSQSTLGRLAIRKISTGDRAIFVRRNIGNHASNKCHWIILNKSRFLERKLSIA
jgi:hypothetical protein